MNLVDQIKYKAIVTKYGMKYGMKYALMHDDKIEIELLGIKGKYKLSDEDYVRMLIGVQIMAIRAVKKPEAVNTAKMVEYAKIDEKVV